MDRSRNWRKPFLLLVLVGGLMTAPVLATTWNVTVQNDFFSPSTLTVAPGDTACGSC